ncbi:MAG: nucleotidyltransferase family protein [Dehalococcoidia bacterium]|jgi:hypothetical protein
MTIHIDLDTARIAEFCRKWQVAEFALFGSALRDDFGPDSDVDVMVTFASEARRSLFDLVQMRDELQGLFGRDVDLITRPGIERSANWIRREAILSSAETVYAA